MEKRGLNESSIDKAKPKKNIVKIFAYRKKLLNMNVRRVTPIRSLPISYKIQISRWKLNRYIKKHSYRAYLNIVIRIKCLFVTNPQ
jgi:hypothetical protein